MFVARWTIKIKFGKKDSAMSLMRQWQKEVGVKAAFKPRSNAIVEWFDRRRIGDRNEHAGPIAGRARKHVGKNGQEPQTRPVQQETQTVDRVRHQSLGYPARRRLAERFISLGRFIQGPDTEAQDLSPPRTAGIRNHEEKIPVPFQAWDTAVRATATNTFTKRRASEVVRANVSI
jgi:hypothetical protein